MLCLHTKISNSKITLKSWRYQKRLGHVVDDRVIGVPFPAWVRVISLLHSIQTAPGSYPASYRVVLWAVSLGRGEKLTTRLNLVPRLRMSELYLHSSVRLLCVEFTHLIQLRYNFLLYITKYHSAALYSGVGNTAMFFFSACSIHDGYRPENMPLSFLPLISQ
jgi:hypothetical protein